jgi:hypothetical protein
MQLMREEGVLPTARIFSPMINKLIEVKNLELGEGQFVRKIVLGGVLR